MHVLHVVGARPNFLRAAPVVAALRRRKVKQTLVHTGQYQDGSLSELLLEIGLAEPDVHLAVGSGTHAWQTAEIMIRLEPVVLRAEPDLVLVYGDVNATVAAALVSSKIGVASGHVDAGLRSFDRSMPDELNRIVTDQIADLLFTSSADAGENLKAERIPVERIHLVGSVMVDTLVRLLPKAAVRRDAAAAVGLNGGPYGLLTLHRASNIEDSEQLVAILKNVSDASALPIVFPVPPRTAQRIHAQAEALPRSLLLIDPLSYGDFLSIETRAAFVITDSGGVQEETTFLGIPCLTLRPDTDRSVTIAVGSNTLLGNDVRGLKREIRRILSGHGKTGAVPPLWDGCAAERVADVIVSCPKKQQGDRFDPPIDTPTRRIASGRSRTHTAAARR